MSTFEDLQEFAKQQEMNQQKCRQFVQRYFSSFSEHTGWPADLICFRSINNQYDPDVSKATFIWEHGFMVFDVRLALAGNVAQMVRLFKVKFDLSDNMINYKFIVGSTAEAPVEVDPRALQASFESVIEEFQAVLAHQRPSLLPDHSKDAFDLLRDAVQGK